MPAPVTLEVVADCLSSRGQDQRRSAVRYQGLQRRGLTRRQTACREGVAHGHRDEVDDGDDDGEDTERHDRRDYDRPRPYGPEQLRGEGGVGGPDGLDVGESHGESQSDPCHELVDGSHLRRFKRGFRS